MLNKLEAVGIEKYYSSFQVLFGIDLYFEAGKIYGLLGKNGAGKTTTFHCLVGLLSPEKGKILLNGQDITYVPTHIRAKLGLVYLPQENSVFKNASVYENLMIVAQENFQDNIEKRVQESMRMLSIEHIKDSRANRISGGEKRRVEIARAMLLSPRFLLLDEPFSGVDPITVSELQSIILELKKHGTGIVITDHNVDEVFSIADRAYIIDEGRVIAEGTPDELRNNPEARKRFLG